MGQILSLRRGRPRRAEVDPSLLEVLTLPQVIAYARAKGQPIGRARLSAALISQVLPAHQDLAHRDRYGKPLVKVERVALDAWLGSFLRPFTPAPMPGAPSMSKGPLPRAL